MPAPYSKDLRQKAIAAVEGGECKSDVSRMLKISRNTLDLWIKRKEQTGNCQANTHYQQGNQHKITKTQVSTIPRPLMRWWQRLDVIYCIFPPTLQT